MQRLQSGKERGTSADLTIFFLTRVEWLYRFVTAVRSALYNRRILRPARLSCKVISVGNLTTGGTGKTPVTKFLAARISSNRKTAILSRAYGSTVERTQTTLKGSEIKESDASQYGDEVVELASTLPIVWFGLGSDRKSTGAKLVQEHGVEIALLDDGFQHRKLHRDLDIVLIDASNPVGNGHWLPTGPLRESLKSLQRADIVLLTKTNGLNEPTLSCLEGTVSEHFEKEKIFRMATSISKIRPLEHTETLDLQNKSVWLFGGIGNPEHFEQLARGSGLRVAGCTWYPDHNKYDERDLATLRRILDEGKADCLLTTAKDAVKIPKSTFPAHKCGVVEIGIDFVARADIFWSIIGRCVGAEI